MVRMRFWFDRLFEVRLYNLHCVNVNEPEGKVTIPLYLLCYWRPRKLLAVLMKTLAGIGAGFEEPDIDSAAETPSIPDLLLGYPWLVRTFEA